MTEASQPDLGAASAPQSMVAGAFAVLDALGWKGIWKAFDPHVVLRRAGDLQEFAERQLRDFVHKEVRQGPHDYGNSGAAVTFISDSVALGIHNAQGDQREAQFDLQMLLAEYIAPFLREAAGKESDPCLLYRGAISGGQFVQDSARRLILGPAVDEAAGAMDLADGAFVWFPRPYGTKGPESDAALLYAVPLKSGGTFEAMTVNPFFKMTTTDAEVLRDRMLRSFERNDGRFDVHLRRKQDNTRKFLDEAMRRL